MDWITGLQKAIDYVEAHITEEIDYEQVAAESFSSSYHFQRIFSILCGYTLGEYIRLRRLSLAGAELVNGDEKVIDIALKYGYDSPVSFAKAFQKFHGVSPSQARSDGKTLKSFSRLSVQMTKEGGNTMNYRIEEKDAMILTGYKARFNGIPYGKDRAKQEETLFVTTRGKQWFLRGASENPDAYCVVTNIDDAGYDFYYCHKLDNFERSNLCNPAVTGVDPQFVEAMNLEHLEIPKTTYVVFETEHSLNPISDYFELLNQRIKILTEWMPEMGFRLAEGPELYVHHWLPRSERHIQIWLPIEKQ
ncbi:MAG: AraC family transcriptional regulator [Clostridia bacterium]|nr:AraC family transcriptional regulator [Clostridia bacterium]